MIRPKHTTPGIAPREAFTPREWYTAGATEPPYSLYYYYSHNDGHRRAYLAGVIARAFGVDLSAVLP